MSSDKVFQITDTLFVTETVARDTMHPTRTVNTVYVIDTETDREHFISQNNYAYGPTLTAARAYSYAKKFL